ncbi:hypothetical protein [Candidatus Tisiphia endosymbiont of Parasteatoda lunata]|uniref:hypothetical protein n=1 Tax=Candidatus Tisiphia endosymbiont of Parasteatoda lunata TaxID=3066275 RepID=UPI00313AF118
MTIKSYGWQAIYDKDLVALKSPYNLHRCNLCWNVHSETMLQKIITFYQDIPFFLYNTHDINSNYLQLDTMLESLNLLAIRDVYQKISEQVIKGQLSPIDYLQELVQIELEQLDLLLDIIYKQVL